MQAQEGWIPGPAPSSPRTPPPSVETSAEGWSLGPAPTTLSDTPRPPAAGRGTAYDPASASRFAHDLGEYGLPAAGAAATLLIPGLGEIEGAGLLAAAARFGLRNIPPILGSAIGGAIGSPLTGATPIEGAESGAGQELVGRAISWPIAKVLRSRAAVRVAEDARAHFTALHDAAASRLQSALDVADHALTTAKDSWRTYSADALTRATALRDRVIADARTALQTTLTQTAADRAAVEATWAAKQTAAHQAVTQASARWENLPLPAHSPTAVGQRVNAVIQGPARQSLETIGKAVGTTAESGPELDWTPIKDYAAQLAQQIRPVTSHLSSADAEYARLFGGDTGSHLSQAEKLSAIARLTPESMSPAGVTALEPDHPLPGVLRDIAAMPDRVPFAEAHKAKRLLDETVHWASPARRQVQQITKATRNAIRASMSVHEPYNLATAAYEATIPLFNKGIAANLNRAILDRPQTLIKNITLQDSTRLQILHDLLLHHAAEGGDMVGAGQAAWDSLRSAITHERLIQGGLKGFEDAVTRMSPEVQHLLYGDEAGKAVLDNLHTIHSAWRMAQTAEDAAQALGNTLTTDASTTAAQTASAARATAASTMRGARATAAQTAANVRHVGSTALRADAATTKQVTQAARTTAEAERRAIASDVTRFGRSSLGSPPPSFEDLAWPATHILLATHSPWARAALIRDVMSGPRIADLIHYAALSTPRTQAFVRAVTGPLPGAAVADLLRAAEAAYATGDQ